LDDYLNKKAEQPNYIVVFVTVKEVEEARKIAKDLVKRRLAACVNILPEIESHFWWKDKLEAEKEILLIIKTKDTLLTELTKAVKKIHSYSMPEIIALPITGGSRDYLEWVDSEIM
jgi:periplasmic divalent cation tolerance protein